MRVLSLVSLAACGTSYGAVTVTPPDAPVGVGLVATFEVRQDLCDEGFDGECSKVDITPRVTIDSGESVALGHDLTNAFTVTGVAEGTTTLDVYGQDDAVSAIDVTTGLVTATHLSVQRQMYPEVAFPLVAFAHSHIAVAQASVGADGPRAGVAPLTVDAGASGASYDAFDDWIDTGESLGTATVSTPLAAGGITIVDGSAIASFTVGGATSVVVPYTNNPVAWYLLPVDSFGAPIVGAGAKPSFVVADPDVLVIVDELVDHNMRGVTVKAKQVGATTVDIVWGAAHATIAVTTQ